MEEISEERLSELERYTISGNAVPVERVTIPAQDLRDLIANIRHIVADRESLYQSMQYGGEKA